MCGKGLEKIKVLVAGSTTRTLIVTFIGQSLSSHPSLPFSFDSFTAGFSKENSSLLSLSKEAYF